MVFLNKLIVLCCVAILTNCEEYTTIQQKNLHREVEQIATSATFVNSRTPSEEFEPPKYEAQSASYDSFYSPELSSNLQPPRASPTIATFFNPAQNYDKFTPDYTKGALKVLHEAQPEYFAENYSPLKVEERAKINNLNIEFPPIPSEDLQLPLLTPYNPNNDPKLYFSDNLENVDTNINQKVPTQLYPKKYNPKFNKKLKVVPIENSVDYVKVPNQRSDNFAAIPTYITKINENPKKKYIKKPKNKEYKNPSSDYSLKNFEKTKLLQPADSTIEQVKSFQIANESPVDKLSAQDSGIQHAFASNPFSQNIEHEPQGTGFYEHSADVHQANHKGDRLEFQMHGHQGPDSYKFGFDTGKGHDRQFRYEERDKDGHVKGHYGYYDKHGKLRVINYDADPHEGFRAHPQ